MNVRQFQYFEDNLGYLVYGKEDAIAVDGGAVDEILSFVESKGLKLKYVVNTHTHPDHTSGNKSLIDKTGAVFISIDTLINNKEIELEKEKIVICHTPGHSNDSIIFYFDNILLTGDTLLNGKAGRCFTGDLKGFLKSIKHIMTFPENTLIYGGHNYVEEYMETAIKIEPDNKYIDDYVEKYDPLHVYSTLEEELKVNPSLRFNDKKMITILKSRDLPTETEYDRWSSIVRIV